MLFGAAPMLHSFAFSTGSLPPNADSLNWDIISRRSAWQYIPSQALRQMVVSTEETD